MQKLDCSENKSKTSAFDSIRSFSQGRSIQPLRECLRLFRPKDTRLAKVYDHVVESDLLGVLLGPLHVQGLRLSGGSVRFGSA